MPIHVGCAGFQMARPKYFGTFPVVEVQQTFYQPPQIKTLEKWRAGAPTGFEFTIKAWQLITHTPASPTYRRLGQPVPPEAKARYGRFQLTDEVRAAWLTTRACAATLGARIILFQCPASFLPTPDNVANLRAFFTHLAPDRGDLIFGLEPRGAWPPDLIRDLAATLKLVHVVDPFHHAPTDQGPLRYLRLHGLPGTNYKHTYTDDELRRLADWCTSDTTYVLFNNLTAPSDAQRFIRLLDGKFSGPPAIIRDP